MELYWSMCLGLFTNSTISVILALVRKNYLATQNLN